ncbi:MAG TPA: glycosyltransferase [Gemmatimonadaceae bacterium]|nr:glycosyltransferase [Gemmatimonadaceae bacterium]
MRILILGEDAPGGLMGSYKYAFEELGAVVRTYCLASAYRAVLPGIRTRALRRVAEPVLLAAFNERILADLAEAEADLVLVLKGHRLRAATVDALRDVTDAPVVNFYPDDPFSTERSNRLAFGTTALAAYDACFTFARHLVPAYERAAVRAIHYLPFARDPRLHAPVALPSARAFDVVFVGNLDDFRVRCLDALATRHRVAVFGERTTTVVPKGTALAASVFGPAAYGEALAHALARGAISLNVMRPQNARSHNMRSFESPACGAFTLTQRTEELAGLFADGDEVAGFDTIDELCDAARRWLADDAGRSRVARAGFERVRNDTYARRATTILERVGVASRSLP